MKPLRFVVGKTTDGKNIIINKYDESFGWNSMILTIKEAEELMLKLKEMLGGEKKYD